MIVRIPDNFTEEREYVLSVILDTLLHLDYRVERIGGATGTSLLFNGHELVIRDHFFQPGRDMTELCKEDRIPQKVVDGTGPLAGLQILYGADEAVLKGKQLVIRADLIGSAFFMLSRWEEMFLPKDQHGRVTGTSALAFRAGFHLRPVVNEYAAFLRQWLERAGMSFPPAETFRKVFTCDVDLPYYWRERPLQKLMGSLLGKHPGHPPFTEKWRSFQAYRRDRTTDPYFTFERLMQDAARAGADMQFYLMAGGKSAFDPPGYLDDRGIRELAARLLQSGQEIGLHGSYDTHLDPDLLRSEKEQLEEAIGQPVRAVRQHFLRCDAAASPSTWASAGFEHDATMGFADIPGFRHGICHPFPLFDLQHRKMGKVTEWPLTCMDATLLHYLKAAPAEATRIVETLAGEIRRHRGVFVFLWHNSSFEYGGYAHYLPVYNSLLSC